MRPAILVASRILRERRREDDSVSFSLSPPDCINELDSCQSARCDECGDDRRTNSAEAARDFPPALDRSKDVDGDLQRGFKVVQVGYAHLCSSGSTYYAIADKEDRTDVQAQQIRPCCAQSRMQATHSHTRLAALATRNHPWTATLPMPAL